MARVCVESLGSGGGRKGGNGEGGREFEGYNFTLSQSNHQHQSVVSALTSLPTINIDNPAGNTCIE